MVINSLAISINLHATTAQVPQVSDTLEFTVGTAELGHGHGYRMFMRAKGLSWVGKVFVKWGRKI